MEWKERTVLVTGASSGIGLETARKFLERGAQVFMNARNQERLDEAVNSLQSLPGTAVAVPGDVSRVEQCEAVIRQIDAAGGNLDVLVNAAGVWISGKSDNMTEENWDTIMNINAKGTFFMCRYAIPLLEKNSGVIVNVSSDSGLTGNKEAAIYCASKGAVTLMTRAMAVELAERGIRVNAVCPGDVLTPMMDKAFRESGGNDRKAYDKSLLMHYPQGDKARFTQPGEVAEAVLFLASPTTLAITGACLSIDFGLTAGY